ncbi:unnamed protein product [Didymodactylos carnosus]|uniref:Transglutaminase-like domain-containing protein n=1 Tax=Didymodactylos carnosus TaxID=1234261 RepID=A0A814XL94_9BILA|nr:unnamed protein product [Didymodactylos carnosus]CAF3981956.1 unnamed protein product [Didymodactylos carnosus]
MGCRQAKVAPSILEQKVEDRNLNKNTNVMQPGYHIKSNQTNTINSIDNVNGEKITDNNLVDNRLDTASIHSRFSLEKNIIDVNSKPYSINNLIIEDRSSNKKNNIIDVENQLKSSKSTDRISKLSKQSEQLDSDKLSIRSSQSKTNVSVINNITDGTSIHSGIDIEKKDFGIISHANDNLVLDQNNKINEVKLASRKSSVRSQKSSISDNIMQDMINTTIPNISLAPLDTDAFNPKLCLERQNAIDDVSLRKTIDLWKPSSIQQLIEFINKLSTNKTQIEKVWIIFYWISQNISYDDESYFSGNIPSQRADDVFRSKKAVCEGYASLFKRLCDETGLACEKVSGYAKGYSFNARKPAFDDTNHAWNVVKIEYHYYFIESTWGTGHMAENKKFKRELEAHYFLSQPAHMIYNHLPVDEKWQLLARPITMTEYLSMPQTHAAFFEFDLQVVSPHNSHAISIHKDKYYAEILICCPDDIELSGSLKESTNGQKVKGADKVYFDRQNSLWRCQFAPRKNGMHDITIFAKKKSSEGTFSEAVDFIFDIKDLKTFISFPHTWSHFYEYDLEIVAPLYSASVVCPIGASYCEILIRCPDDIELHGSLKESTNGQKVKGADKVYFDRQNSLWRCQFAPRKNGMHDIIIFAKKKSSKGTYAAAVDFIFDAKDLKTFISFPHTWSHFYEYDLEIVAPLYSGSVVCPIGASYCEILIRCPDDVKLSGHIEQGGQRIQQGDFIQYIAEKELWQCLFAPKSDGLHEITIFAKKLDEKESTEATIHCLLPGATEVNMTVDSEWLSAQGYENNVFKRTIKVGSQVTMWQFHVLREIRDGSSI